MRILESISKLMDSRRRLREILLQHFICQRCIITACIRVTDMDQLAESGGAVSLGKVSHGEVNVGGEMIWVAGNHAQ